MMVAANRHDAPVSSPHIPVLLDPILDAVAPVSGGWLDGTFGAGGYTRALLDAGADYVIAVDRDPLAFELAADWAAEYGKRLIRQEANFADMDDFAEALDGVVLDLGVSSMQLDRAERGFSFRRDGPLDMRMSQDGPTAAELINSASEAELADILFQYGEERASRRIARAIVAARPLTRTGELAAVIAGCLPRARPDQSDPATRSFQALRIAVNDELGSLIAGLEAAERVLKPGGFLVVVTFHSLEDRVVKKFLQHRSGARARANRFAPEEAGVTASFGAVTRKAIAADAAEIARNPRARSARLRIARRTDAPPMQAERSAMGLPGLVAKRG